MKFLLLIFSLIFVNCATHMPMSETTVLSSKKVVLEDNGMSSQGLIMNDDGEFSKRATSNEKEYLPTIAVSLFKNFYLDKEDLSKGAISLSFGKGFGTDFTIKVIGPIYVSGGVSLPENYFISTPLRLFENNTIGISISPVYRQQGINFYRDTSFNIFRTFTPDGYDNYNSIGLKSNILLVPYSVISSMERSFISFKIESGKFLELDDYYVSIGASFGVF